MVVRKHVRIEFNRIFEFMNIDGTGLSDSSTRHIDPVTKAELPGIPCDKGNFTSAANPGKNCVLQDFFLDSFKLSQVSQEGTLRRVSFATDLQGTSPWCNKATGNKACATPPVAKPTVVIDLGADFQDFSHTKMNITIGNFPYKSDKSSLALRAKVFALKE